MIFPKGWKNLWRRYQGEVPELLEFAQSLPYSNKAIINFLSNVAFSGWNIDLAFRGLEIAARAGYNHSDAFEFASIFIETDKPTANE